LGGLLARQPESTATRKDCACAQKARQREPPTPSAIRREEQRLRYELEHLLRRAGFSELTFYRDFAKTSWTSGAEIIVVARV
jgi:hypothetical protein